nr:nitrogen permease regulator 3 [Quercus suber]
MDRPCDHIDLLAIFLITRSRPGPKLVFHYPVCPKSSGRPDACDLDSDSEDASETELAEDNPDVEHSLFERPLRKIEEPLQVPKRPTLSGRNDTALPAENILGHSVESLEMLLSPGRWSDGEKFEVEMDGITFVGHPTFSAMDGNWADLGSAELSRQSLRHTRATDCRKNSTAPHDASGSKHPTPRTTHKFDAISDTTMQAINRDFTHAPESFDSQRGASLATSLNSTSTSSGMLMEQMTMFNIVVACTSKSQIRMKDFHYYVLTKLSKALHYCQRQSNYVGSESRKLSNLKIKARQDRLDREAESTLLLEGSELAWMMMEVYEKIRSGNVANFKLDGIEMSLQIPNSSSSDVAGETALSPHAGLLLLESKEALLRELKQLDTAPLAYFIQEHTPTKSLQKHATNLQLPIRDILYLAQHLIAWRKARAIAPLHQRNFYVAAKGAPLDQASQRAPGLLRRFPALPSLPMILQMLSGRPIKFGLLIPSRDHRQTYMDLLAYLLRYGFVAQLKTSGWLKMPEHLRQLGKNENSDVARSTSALSSALPHIRSVEDDSASVSSERTTIPFATAVTMKNRSRQTSDESRAVTELNGTADDNPVILHPSEPCPIEADALEYIRSTIVDAEFHEQFSSLLQYFDGEHTLEDIAAYKGIKRAKLEAWLETLAQTGHLVTYRHL